MRGSIVKRGKTWSYVLYLGRDETGVKRQKWVGGFRTRRDAVDALNEAINRVRTGNWADPGRQTVGEYLEVWLTAVKPGLADSTWASYSNVLSTWVVPRLGHKRLTVAHGCRSQPRLRRAPGGRRPDWSPAVEQICALRTHGPRAGARRMRLCGGAHSPTRPIGKSRAGAHQGDVCRTAEAAHRFLAAVSGEMAVHVVGPPVTPASSAGRVAGLRWSDIGPRRGPGRVAAHPCDGRLCGS